jgi:type VI secretion system secreted protein Hcp
MAIPGYMSLTDDAGNSIKGSVKVKDRENQIEVLGLYHNVSYNSDLHNGRALSKRQHRPFSLKRKLMPPAFSL